MGRAPCCDKANVKRGPWSPEEDAALKSYIEKHGTGGNWIALPQKAGLRRCGKSCRLRWLNYLRPDIKHGGFTEEEDNIICTLYDRIGSRWSVIASHLAGRTDNDVKNYWNTKLKKKLMARQAKSIHSPSPTPPTPILPAVKTEALSSVDFDFSIPLLPNYGLPQQSQKLYSDAMPFSMMSLIEQPDLNANGRVVSPSEEFSAASSSMTVENSSSSNSYFNWPCSTGVGSNDLLLSAVGFGDINGDFFSSYGYQLENLGEVTPCYISNPPIMWPAPETKAQGLQQSLAYS